MAPPLLMKVTVVALADCTAMVVGRSGKMRVGTTDAPLLSSPCATVMVAPPARLVTVTTLTRVWATVASESKG